MRLRRSRKRSPSWRGHTLGSLKRRSGTVDEAALVERYVYAVASIAVMPSAAVVATAQARHIQRR
jgi:hypothetical protein